MEQGLNCYRWVKLGSSKLNLRVHRSNSGSQVPQVFCGLTNLTHRSNHKTCTNASINAKVETTLIFNKFCFLSFCQAEFLIIGSCLFFVNWIFEILWCQHTFYWIYHIIDHLFYLSILVRMLEFLLSVPCFNIFPLDAIGLMSFCWNF